MQEISGIEEEFETLREGYVEELRSGRASMRSRSRVEG